MRGSICTMICFTFAINNLQFFIKRNNRPNVPKKTLKRFSSSLKSTIHSYVRRIKEQPFVSNSCLESDIPTLFPRANGQRSSSVST